MSVSAPDPSPEMPALAAGSEAVTAALAELRTLVYRLADEVATFRRRALTAESRLRELEPVVGAAGTRDAGGAAVQGVADATGAVDDGGLARITELERENEQLRARLDEAADRTRQLLERTRFLRQQQDDEAEEST